MYKNKTLLLLVLIGALALILRGIASYQMYGCQAVQQPLAVTDMATYWTLSEQILHGQWPDHFDYQPFYYSIFLPLCRIVSGNGVVPCIVFQCLLGALACVLVGFAGKRIFGTIAGVSGALLLAISKMHVFYTPFCLFEVMQSFWVALLLWMAVWCYQRNKWWQWLLLALVLACATLTRGNALLFLPGILVLMFFSGERNSLDKKVYFGKKALLALAMVVLFELPQLPYSIRNYHYMGRWCGASTAGDKVLALGNTPEAPPGGLEYPMTYSRWVAQSDAKPGEGHVSMASNIIHWALREPIVFIELKCRALILFWDKQEIANNVSVTNEGRACPWLMCLLPFSLIGSLAVFGALTQVTRLRKADATHIFFLYMLVCSWFATALFYNLARFRVTSLPLIALSAGVAVEAVWGMIQKRAELKRDDLFKFALGLAFSVFFVCQLFTFWQENIEVFVYRWARHNGLLCDFGDVHLAYDHGPFTVGGVRIFTAPTGGVTIQKRFGVGIVPDGGKAKVRLAAIPADKEHFTAKLLHAGKSYTVDKSNIKYERFVAWLEVELPEVETNEFTWVLPEGTHFSMDVLRDYSRTCLVYADGKSEYPQYEAVVELEW